MNYLLNIIKGIVIGAGAILPGVSSGVICVIFGIYEKLLSSVLNFFKNIKENFRLLFPIALGTIIGIVIFGNILKCLFFYYPLQTKFTFIGLIIRMYSFTFQASLFKTKIQAHIFAISSHITYIWDFMCILRT